MIFFWPYCPALPTLSICLQKTLEDITADPQNLISRWCCNQVVKVSVGIRAVAQIYRAVF